MVSEKDPIYRIVLFILLSIFIWTAVSETNFITEVDDNSIELELEEVSESETKVVFGCFTSFDHYPVIIGDITTERGAFFFESRIFTKSGTLGIKFTQLYLYLLYCSLRIP